MVKNNTCNGKLVKNNTYNGILLHQLYKNQKFG